MLWSKLSLLARISIAIGAVFVAVLAIAIVFLLAAAPSQMEEEEESIDRLTIQFVQSALKVIETSPNPDLAFRTYLAELRNRSDHTFSFRTASSGVVEQDENKSESSAPPWFVELVRPPRPFVEIPVVMENRELGQILYRANVTADIEEKWLAFLAVVLAAIGLTAVSLTLAYVIIARSLSPLSQIERALSELRAGNYLVRVACDGPPELANSCRELNDLASRLSDLSTENRDLMRRVVLVQDEERNEVSRELHDELGPLLFAIRANATSLRKSFPADSGKTTALDQLLAATEAVQDANRRILEKLHPMDFRNIGLERSLQSLADGMRGLVPSRHIDITIDPTVESADETTLLSTYRVVQEGLTNALRHTQASQITIDVACGAMAPTSDKRVTVTISDNGGGMAAGTPYGRGLTGMKERLLALGGTFSVTSDSGYMIIRGSLPFS
jgi:two-component system sensor histidine kinase UhpB